MKIVGSQSLVSLVSVLFCIACDPTKSCNLLGKGWNLGNRLEWQVKWGLHTRQGGSAASVNDFEQEIWTKHRHDALVFEKVKEEGFDWVRIPVSYNEHTDTHSDANGRFVISERWLTAVETHVNFGLSAGLKVKINVHHENKKLSDTQLESCKTSTDGSPVCRQGWMDMGDERDELNLGRLVSIWQQVASRFVGVDPQKLVFEVFNEPHQFVNITHLNQIMSRSVQAIRGTGGYNEKRLIFIAGMRFSNPKWIAGEVGSAGNPGGLSVDDFMVPAGDPNIGLTVHSYDTFKYCGGNAPESPEGDISVWGASHYSEMFGYFHAVKMWAENNGIREVSLSEMGCTLKQLKHGMRKEYYKQTSSAARNANISYAVWDDNSNFAILTINGTHPEGTWDHENVLSQLAELHTCGGNFYDTEEKKTTHLAQPVTLTSTKAPTTAVHATEEQMDDATTDAKEQEDVEAWDPVQRGDNTAQQDSSSAVLPNSAIHLYFLMSSFVTIYLS